MLLLQRVDLVDELTFNALRSEDAVLFAFDVASQEHHEVGQTGHRGNGVARDQHGA